MARVALDHHRYRQFAAMTALLVGVLAALGAHLLLLGDAAAALFLHEHGAEPSRVLALLHWRHPYRTLYGLQAVGSAMMLHAHLVQLASSMAILLLFGLSVEDRIGHYRFLLLFLAGGAISLLAQALVEPDSQVAFVGAQGAAAGVAGASLVLAPRGTIPTMIRGLDLPWVFAPVIWLLLAIVAALAPLPTPAGVAPVGLPYVVLAYAAGAALGPFYSRTRPVLLRG
jgi:membrane associated rhomboid family serine protease